MNSWIYLVYIVHYARTGHRVDVTDGAEGFNDAL
jgi:hypothetical protein